MKKNEILGIYLGLVIKLAPHVVYEATKMMIANEHILFNTTQYVRYPEADSDDARDSNKQS